MAEIEIRAAVAADLPAIERLMHDAFAGFIPLTGQAPQPMVEDHAALIAQGVVWVLLEDARLAAAAVMTPASDHLLLWTVAVTPARQSAGHGRRLIAFAEDEARRRGLSEIRAVVHVTMAKALRLYRALGYEQVRRVEQGGYYRVFLKKRLG